MSNFIIGTSGHIDHGKTTLIKALTGRETDRLEEEKERGISIELGFTYFDLPNGKRAGIVDVPGHEKFLKNMLAGVSGMDVVMLVIAADEGIMKQTKEHIDILRMLDIHEGIIVLTKIDMVDNDWLELISEDIREYVKGTFLENSPILPVSSTKNIGIDKLVEVLTDMSETINKKEEIGVPRLPVDRTFTIQGFGTVVTGTLLTGKFKVGDEIEIYPKNIKARIRSIQVHGVDASEASAGQRVAINIANVKKSFIDRGDIIAHPNTFSNTMMLDVKLNLLKDSPRIIENRTRLRLYLGSKEVLCRAILLDNEMLTPGDEGYVQLRLEEEIIARKGDKFVVRFYSPMETIGGGIIIEANPKKKKRFDENVIEELFIREQGSFSDVLENKINDTADNFISANELELKLSMKFKDFSEEIEKLLESNRINGYIVGKDRYYITKTNYDIINQNIIKSLNEYHEKYPLRIGASKEEIRSKFLYKLPIKISDVYLEEMQSKEFIEIKNENLLIYGYKSVYEGISKEIHENILNTLLEGKFSPINIYEIVESYNAKQRELVEEIVNTMIATGELCRLSETLVFHRRYYDEAESKLIEYLNENQTITMAEFRDMLDTSRKYAVALLEDFDKKKLTIREDDARKLFKTQR